MKKLIKNGLLAALMIFVASSTKVTAINSELMTVQTDLDYVKEGSKITIRDAKNNIVYTETIENSLSIKDEFQLPNLGQGAYTLEIEYDFEISVRPFEVTLRSVQFVDEEAYTIFKPVISTMGKKLLLSKLTLNNETFDILVYDYKGDLLYSEKVSNEIEMNRVYDFSELAEDKFSVVFRSKDRTFTKNIKF